MATRSAVRSLAVAAGGAAVLLGAALRFPVAGAHTSSPYLTATATRGSLTATVSATGSLAPVRVSKLTAVDGGIVQGLTVKAGQAVKQGQVLARIDDAGSLSSQVLSMEQTLASDEASLASQNAPRSAASALRLAQGQVTADVQQLTSLEAERRQAPLMRQLAAAQVADERAKLRALEIDAQGRVTAPISGQVAVVDVKPGEHVTEGQLLEQMRSSLEEDSSEYTDVTSPADGTVVALPVPPLHWVKEGATILRLSEPAINLQVLEARQALAQDQQQIADGTYLGGASGGATGASGGATAASGASSTASSSAAPQSGAAGTSGAELNLAILKEEEALREDEATLAQLRSGQETPAQAEANVLRVKVGEDRRALAALQAEQAQLTVRAPFDGVVESLSVDNGASVSQGATILALADESQLQLDMKIDELDVDRVHVGQAVTVTIDALAGRRFSGRVASVSQVGSSSNGRASFAATVVLTRPQGARVGMTAEAAVDVAAVQDALLVPVEAIHTEGGKTVVVVAHDGAFETVPVSTGLANASEVQILSGLHAGQQVVTSELGSTQTPNGPLNVQGKNVSGPGGHGGPGGAGAPGAPPAGGPGR